jgi:hypothetical protein
VFSAGKGNTLPESPEEQEKRVLREREGKNIQHYSVLLNAWIQIRMEYDKTLLTLSSAGIGLLVTLATTVGAKTFLERILFMLSFISFLICIYLLFKIYEFNCSLIEGNIANKDDSQDDQCAKEYDKHAKWVFIAGVLCLALIGAAQMIGKL